MEAITQHTGVAAPLLEINIDTDAIIPSREVKGVSKKGLGEGLFAVRRYSDLDTRTPNPDFVLNQAAFANTSILLGGLNFGCGSSREHAVWALVEYGIKAIISPSFGSIFYQNCVRNGIAPVTLENDIVVSLAEEVKKDPQKNTLCVDLEKMQVLAPSGKQYSFELEKSHREMLLNGLDAIGLTLTLENEIRHFETAYRNRHPWAKTQVPSFPE